MVRRAGGELDRRIRVVKQAGEPLGLEVSAAVFDRVRTCDNHCAFCFIYQLPKGMRKSLYLKDDDYRLSFLYGNFTTLTRFTELDAERVITERLGPLFVSIHATDPGRAGGHAAQPAGGDQPAVAPGPARRRHRGPRPGGGLPRGERRRRSWRTPCSGSSTATPSWRGRGRARSGSAASRTRTDMRPHTTDEAAAVLATVAEYQELSLDVLGRRLVFASDEYFLMAGEPFPTPTRTRATPSTRTASAWSGRSARPSTGDAGAAHGVRPGFFAWVDGAPADGYRAPRPIPSAAAGETAPRSPS